MSIDTREKRQNVAGVGRPWMRHKFPSASLDEQWRISSGLSYGGNPLSPALKTFPDGKTLTKIGPTSKTLTKIGPSSSTVTIP